VVASAIIVPAQEAHLAFIGGGNVAAVNVTVGESVKAVMVELDNALLHLEVERAQRLLRELTSPASIANAEKSVATAQELYDEAKKKVDSLNRRQADNVTIKYLTDQVTLAQNALDRAKDAYQQTSGLSDVEPARAKASIDLYNAQRAYNVALGNLSWYTELPTENDIALVTADFDLAAAALQEAKWYVTALKNETIPAEATGLQLAQLQQAKADLKAAEARLDQSRLIAPIDGIIAEVNVLAGEFASPGKTLITISNVEQLQIVTTDLSERDITSVQVGATATITINALKKDFSGKVMRISPVANTLGGDVIYEVTLTFDEQPAGALAGMTADVAIGE
jgi:HlyD family secretion protein